MNLKKWFSILAALVLTLGIGIGFLTYFLFQSRTENKALQDAFSIMEDNFYKQLENNQIKFDSIQIQIKRQDGNLKNLRKDFSNLETTEIEINDKSNENKDYIYNVTDADSLTGIISRRYR